MPRAQDPAREQARKMWEASGGTMKLREIASRLNVPEKSVSGWKCKDNWIKKNNRSTPKEKRSTPISNTPKRKRGAQPGNGPQGGAKPGNLNAVKHGAFMRIYGNLLSEDERELTAELLEMDEYERLIGLYAQFQISERRLMKHINDIENGEEMIVHRAISLIRPTGQKHENGKEITKVVEISQEQETRKEQLRNYIDALTRVRAEMRRVADSLTKLNESNQSGGVQIIFTGEDALMD